MSAPRPDPTPRRHSFTFGLIQLRIAMVELGRSLELRPQYAELAPDAFEMASFVAAELRLEARR